MDFYIPGQVPIASSFGVVDDNWRRFFELLASTVTSQGASLAAVPGVNRWALADQPTLGVSDTGYVAFVSDYGHFVRWDGSAWEFAPGDVGNGFLRAFTIAPQEVGWGLCDGSSYDYLVVGGATLTTASVTTPDLAGSAAYLKSAAAYTGAVAAGAGASGATAPTISGSTATEAGHTHAGTTDNTPNIVGDTRVAGTDLYGFSTTQHNHTFTTGAGSAHSHGVGTLAVGSHTHGLGTLDPSHVDVLYYVRR